MINVPAGRALVGRPAPRRDAFDVEFGFEVEGWEGPGSNGDACLATVDGSSQCVPRWRARVSRWVLVGSVSTCQVSSRNESLTRSDVRPALTWTRSQISKLKVMPPTHLLDGDSRAVGYSSAASPSVRRVRAVLKAKVFRS